MKKISVFWPILIQVLQVPIVITLFKVMPDKRFAGLLGAAMFLSVIFILLTHFHKKLGMKSFAVYTLLVQLFAFVIPILMFRLAFWGTPFNEIEVAGFQPKILHSLSEKFFVVILWASIYDCFKIMRKDSDK